MTSSLLDTAVDVLPRMLEDAAFLFTELPAEPMEFRSEPFGVGIAYQGLENGELRLWAQGSFMNVLAANMLGLDETDPSISIRRMDSLGEILNIVLGHCLTDCFGESETMLMGLPRHLSDGEHLGDLASGRWLAVEGEPVLVAWRGESS